MLPELRFQIVPAADARDPRLRAQLLDTWTRVTDAGGAVGFVAPANPDLIAATLDASLAAVASGESSLGVLERDGRAVGMGLLVGFDSTLRRHWRDLLRLMVDPELQGRGAGGQLLEGLHGHALELGLEQLRLTVRGGTGLENFYARFGYTEVGRHPGAIRAAPGDDRDEIVLVVRL